MNLAALKRRSALSTPILFALAFSVGCCVFHLQVVSIVKLLQETGLQFLPSLMVIQALSSWLLLRLWGTSAVSSVDKFFLTALGVGFSIALFSKLVPSSDPIYLGSLYVLSQLSISALRMGIHVTFSKRISILRNPQISTQLSMAEESGFLIGALILAYLPGEGWGYLILATSPFVLGAFLFGSVQKHGMLRRTASSQATHGPRRRPSFFKVMIGLFTLVASLKSIQWFGMAYGLTLAAQAGSSLIKVFSQTALIQSALTVTILGASLGFSKKIPTWSLGFKAILIGQAISALTLMAFPGPLLLVGAEIFRKVMEHGFLARSLQLLTSSIPDEDRLEIRHLMERWSTTIGVVAGGLLSLALMNSLLPMWSLWVVAFGMAIGGLFVLNKLFENLSDFHVANLNRARLDGIIQACQVLGSPECKKHYAALTTLLKRGPRPIITKNILTALGRMQEKAVISFATPFMNSNREDIQLSAVRALVGYRGHEVNLILLKKVREMVGSPSAIRINVIRCMTQRLERLVIPYFIELVEAQPEDRVMANAIEILGEIAHDQKDAELKSYLSKFLEHPTSRRIRANAVVVLLGDRRYHDKALEAFERLLTSAEEADQDAAAYVAGRCGLSAHEAFIWERSERQRHRNDTLLLALHRLRNPSAPALIAGAVIEDDEEKSLMTLTKLSVLSPSARSEVFFEIIEQWPEKLELVLSRMRKSQREFDHDRELIREEAHRRGVDLHEEDAWSKEEQPVVKDVA